VLRIKSPQDVGAAAVFVGIGLAGLYFGRDLAFGSSHNMGPGYFPVILSWIIVAIGAIVGVKAVSIEGPPVEPVQLRPMAIIIASILAFGYLVDLVGLALTAALVTLLAAFARRGVNLIETLLLAAGLGVFCVLVFVYGLSQPFPAWWGR
jgi:putative tricarboxylic transport membrane protein